MSDTKEKMLPGTLTRYIELGDKAFLKINLLLEATGGLSLSQVCAVTGLEDSTIQNWVKRGWVEHPRGKKYEEVHIARILIINALKECIKLEHIALLMNYVRGLTEENGEDLIKESQLFNYLCEALKKIGQVDDLSRTGVETAVDRIIKDYKGPTPDARVRIRKALTLMIYACVCTDVKRRTEAMMDQILFELSNPETVEPEAVAEQKIVAAAEPPAVEDTAFEARKTVSQALREWDVSSVERIIIEDDREEKAESGANDAQSGAEEKPTYRPWYLRKNTK